MNLDSVPIIDVSALLRGAGGDESALAQERKLATALEIQRACEESGFFYVKNHGVAENVVGDAFSRARQLFEEVPLVQRQRLAAVKSPLFRGYIGEAEPFDTCGDGAVEESNPGGDSAGACADPEAVPHSKRPKETKQSFTIGAEEFRKADGSLYTSPMHGPNQWPTRRMAPTRSITSTAGTLAQEDVVNDAGDVDLDAESDDPWTEWRADMESYFEACLELSRAIARGLALSLSLDEGFFADALSHPCAQMVLLRYRPPSPEKASRPSERGVGCGAHTDCGFLTILAQDSTGGLEVKHADGRWIEAPPVPGTFIVNLGDMAERWSNDRYKSTRHRVTYSKVANVRYSIPFFCNCNFETPIETIVSTDANANVVDVGVDVVGGDRGRGGGAECSKHEATTAGVYIMEKLGLMREP